MTDKRAGEVKAALYVQARFGFQLLGEEFSEDCLLGEILRADNDAVLAGRPAGRHP